MYMNTRLASSMHAMSCHAQYHSVGLMTMVRSMPVSQFLNRSQPPYTAKRRRTWPILCPLPAARARS